MNLCNRLMRNQTTKLLFLSMLREGCNNNFISGLLEDGVNIMDAIMHKRIVLKDNHDLPDGTRHGLLYTGQNSYLTFLPLVICDVKYKAIWNDFGRCRNFVKMCELAKMVSN